MTKRRGISESRVRIQLGGVFLDEVRTRVDASATGSVAFMTLPAERHSFAVDDGGDTVTITSPALTMMQLAFDGVISADGKRAVELSIDGVIEGVFVVECLRRCEGFEQGEPTLLRLRRKA